MSTFDQRRPVYAKNPGVSPPPPPARTSVPWSTGLCDCHGCSLWCVTCILPCLTFGRIAEIVDEGSTSCATHAALYAIVNYLTGCICVYSGFYREKIRHRYGLEESPCNDFCTHCCCHRCALRQEYRELELRGFDLSIGWNGNIRRNTREAELVQAAPSMQAGMRRQGL